MRLADQLARERTDDDLVRLRESLQARRHVRRLPHDVRALPGRFPNDVADHDRSRIDAHAHREGRIEHVVGRANGGDRIEDRQSAAHGSFRIVLVRLRATEVDKDTIAEILGDVPVVACHDVRARVVIGANHVAQVFRVDAGRERGRVDEVAEHHGERPSFAVAAPRRRARVGVGGLTEHREAACEDRDGLQELFAGSERNVETLQILLGKVGHDLEVDFVLGEAGRVLREAEPLEPLVDIASQVPICAAYVIGEGRIPRIRADRRESTRLSCYVVFELPDDEFLLRDDVLHQIPD